MRRLIRVTILSLSLFVCLFVSQRDVTLKNIRPRVLYDANLGVAGCGLRSIGAGSVVSCVQTVTGEPTPIYRPNGKNASE